MTQAIYDRLPIFAQNLACTYAGYKRAKKRFPAYFEETLALWEKNLTCANKALYAIQRQRLDRLILHSRMHVPHFRNLPPPSTAKDDQQAIAETLSQIPILEKTELAESPGLFLATNLINTKLFRDKTSGTTGTSLTFLHTPESLAQEYACVWRHRRQFGLQRHDPNFSFGGQILVPFAQTAPPFWRRNYYGKQTLFSIYHMTPENLVHYGDALHALPAKYAQGYPSSLHLVAQNLLERDRTLPRGKLAAIFTSSESLLEFQRETIEAAFNAPVYDRYGVSEFAASMTECAHHHLHVDMEYCVIEIEKQEETDTFMRGELIVTGLSNFAQPFIRYRIGDIGTRAKKPCPCGRAGETFLNIDGRIEDIVITPDGRQIGRLDHIFKSQSWIAEAQILQHARESLDVLLVTRKNHSEASEQNLLREFHSRLGSTIQINLHKVTSIPRETNGKFRAVKSFLKTEVDQ